MANAVKRYQGEEYLVDGYVPWSMNAEYSLLHKSTTWTGMGPMLVSLAAWGIFIFDLAMTVFADETTASHSNGFLAKDAANYTDYTGGRNFDGSVFMWAGLVVALVMAVAGVVYTSIGRRDYKAYRKELGIHH